MNEKGCSQNPNLNILDVLLQLLEMCLDDILFRLASTIPRAKELINHIHVLINGRIVDIPSYVANLAVLLHR